MFSYLLPSGKFWRSFLSFFPFLPFLSKAYRATSLAAFHKINLLLPLPLIPLRHVRREGKSRVDVRGNFLKI